MDLLRNVIPAGTAMLQLSLFGAEALVPPAGAARDDASLMLTRDPTLTSPRGEALRQLLYLFEKDEAVRLIRAG